MTGEMHELKMRVKNVRDGRRSARMVEKRVRRQIT